MSTILYEISKDLPDYSRIIKMKILKSNTLLFLKAIKANNLRYIIKALILLAKTKINLKVIFQKIFFALYLLSPLLYNYGTGIIFSFISFSC